MTTTYRHLRPQLARLESNSSLFKDIPPITQTEMQ